MASNRKQSASPPAPPEAGAWVSLGKAATRLNMSRQTVLARVAAKELTAEHIAGRTLISAESLDAYEAKNGAAAVAA